MILISIAIIHNRDQQRLAHILPASRALADRIGATLFEVYEQPVVAPHSFLSALYRQVIRWRIGRDWERHLGGARTPLIKSAIDQAVANLRTKRQFRRSSAVEMIVTSKHIRAWESFVAGGRDFLLVLEDDAVFQADTADRFCAMLDLLADRDMSRLLFVDLGGAFTIDELGASALVEDRRDGFISFGRPVTNSGGAYLIGRTTAQWFTGVLASRPWFRCISIGWLMNGLMMRALAEGAQFDCRHSSPPMFLHGSMIGSYDAWKR